AAMGLGWRGGGALGQATPLYRLLIPLKNISDFKNSRGKTSGPKFRRTDIVATGKFIGRENRVSRPRTHKSRLFGKRWLRQPTCPSQCRTRKLRLPRKDR